jgi:hypothetical protein
MTNVVFTHCSNHVTICYRLALVSSPITVTNGTIPAKFLSLNLLLNYSGMEWWRAFDNDTSTGWNSGAIAVPDYLFVTFDDEYLLTSVQVTAYGDITHDPEIIEFYLDENATYLAANFSFPKAPGYYYTFAPNYFNDSSTQIVAKEILINVAERWSIYQVWLIELIFFGIPY